jgi:type I restriction enzyme S subunit
MGGMSADFVYRLLEVYESIFIKQATGTTFAAITGDVIKNQLIPIPPLAEQRRIVERVEELLSHIKEL